MTNFPKGRHSKPAIIRGGTSCMSCMVVLLFVPRTPMNTSIIIYCYYPPVYTVNQLFELQMQRNSFFICRWAPHRRVHRCMHQLQNSRKTRRIWWNLPHCVLKLSRSVFEWQWNWCTMMLAVTLCLFVSGALTTVVDVLIH